MRVDLAADGLELARDLVAEDPRDPGGRPGPAGEDPDHGRLARAVGTEQTEDLPRAHRKRETFEHLALAGLAGYLAAAQSGFVNPEILSWHESGNVLLMVILGGAGTPLGPIIGALALTLLHEFFSTITRHWQLFLGIAIVLIVLFMPGGLGHLARRVRRSLFGGPKGG